ncbi:ARM repeat-containing protein [Pseudovirgaria hyperparasitica]|uniref:Pumilio homology domain family member 3 n=1 Tax=Pseudovirgaria hyperparasitica TaxID=470096 RepID=A0A6A6W139_9PEZI|nr:ARM repeat-containing protein [Pseudovirgaria hyperparasitica]KAF2755297.1 ARM repeat-containing protein [Pseudovirgaria hyperparasitica]
MPINRTSRFGEIGSGASQLTSEDFPSLGLAKPSTSRPWGPNIWGPGNIGLSSTTNQRNDARPREDGFYAPYKPSNENEEKKGSGSLLESSESDAWGMSRVWGPKESKNPNLPHGRSAGISPSRPLTTHASQASQSYVDISQTAGSQMFSSARQNSNNLSSSNAVQAQLNPTSSAFPFGRQTDSSQNGHRSYPRYTEQDGHNQRAVDSSSGPWAEGPTMHSPTEERRNVANVDYHPTHSNAPSRSGSLPPSRHGNGADTMHFMRHSETYPLPQQQPLPPSSRAQHATFPQSKQTDKRSGSIQSEAALINLRHISIDDDGSESTLGLSGHRASVSVSGISTAYDKSNTRDPGSIYNHGYIFDTSERDPRGNEHHTATRSDSLSMNGNGTMTPEGFPNGQHNDPSTQLRNWNLNNGRGANTPGNSGIGDFRPSPYGSTPHYSTGATPPAFDHLYPSRGEPASRLPGRHSNSFNTSMLDQRLRNIQQQQDPRFTPGNYSQPMLGHAAQYRTQYSYPYQVPPTMMVPPNMQIAGMIPGMEPPRGPRELPADSGRSKILEEFRMNNKSNRRFELKDIFSHIVEFSGDQHGSRFIQQKLESANSDEKERVFKELLGNSLQLMQDVFGNYVIQKFFEHGDQTQKKQLANKMKGHMMTLSTQMYGCRVVQKALEHILTDQQASLIKELEGNVIKCVKDQNGNHVIQKAIERIPTEHIQFIINSFTNLVGTLAIHPYGCRVIQRMLEHCEEPAKSSILQELHAQGTILMSDQYGNYVTQHIIEHGGDQDKERVLNMINAQLIMYSKHKFASNVVEKALVHGTDQHRRAIMEKLSERNERGESQLPGLIKDPYGNYVIQKVLGTLNLKDYADFLVILTPEMDRAKKVMAGKHVQAVEKMMHRLDDRSQSPSATTPPPLVVDPQSPMSNSVPSTSNNSTAGDNHDTVQNSAPKPFKSSPKVDFRNGA